MKSKTNIVILIGLAVVIVLAILVIFSCSKNSIDKLIEDEDVQVNTLINVYRDVLDIVNSDDINIVLDESSLKNIITNEKFKEENILKLKNVEKSIENSQRIYTLSVQYSKSTHVLTVNITESGIGNMKKTQKYKLDVKNGKINYQRDGQGIIVVE